MTTTWDHRSLPEQQRLRDLVVRRWVPEAATYSPFWSQRFRDANLDPTTATSMADLRTLVPSRIWDVAWAGGTGGPALLMRPIEDQVKARASTRSLLDLARAIRSEGIDGKRRVLLEDFKPIHVHRAGPDDELALAYSRSDLDRLHRAGARAAKVLGLSDSDYLVSAVPAEPRLGYWGTYHLGLGASILTLHPRGHGDALETTIDAFELMPTTVVAAPVHEVVEWASLMADVEVPLDRVRTVISVGLPPTPEERAAMADAWRAAGAHADLRVQAMWAPSEARAMWAECRPTSGGDETSFGLHTYPDLEHLETLDPVTLEPLDGHGDLTTTSLGWHGSALLRYRTGVHVSSLTTEPCANCGRTVPRLTDELTDQAWQPIATTSQGDVRLDLRAAADVLRNEPAVQTWRLELRPPAGRTKSDRLVYELAADLDDAQQEVLVGRLTDAVGLQPSKLTVIPDATVVEAGIAKLGERMADLR